jgi:hypothetical protein
MKPLFYSCAVLIVLAHIPAHAQVAKKIIAIRTTGLSRANHLGQDEWGEPVRPKTILKFIRLKVEGLDRI